MKKLIAGFMLLLLGACSVQDGTINLPRKEIENLLTTPAPVSSEPPIPHPVVVRDPPLVPELQKSVSLHVEDSADLREVLIQLCKTEPFHFSREAVLQRLKFLRGS